MRIIFVILLFIVIFMAGMLYGVKYDKADSHNVPPEEPAVMMNYPNLETEEELLEVTIVHTDNTPAFQAASAMESVVQFFYDMIIEFLYHISKVFF